MAVHPEPAVRPALSCSVVAPRAVVIVRLLVSPAPATYCQLGGPSSVSSETVAALASDGAPSATSTMTRKISFLADIVRSWVDCWSAACPGDVAPPLSGRCEAANVHFM